MPPVGVSSGMHLNDILARLRELQLSPNDYVVHSSASLVLRGVLEEAGDVDVVARGDAWRQALAWVERGETELDKGEHDQRVSLDPDVEVYDGWLGESAESLVARAEFVQGVPCAPLADVIAMKQRLDRPKDRIHLARIREHLARRD